MTDRLGTCIGTQLVFEKENRVRTSLSIKNFLRGHQEKRKGPMTFFSLKSQEPIFFHLGLKPSKQFAKSFQKQFSISFLFSLSVMNTPPSHSTPQLEPHEPLDKSGSFLQHNSSTNARVLLFPLLL